MTFEELNFNELLNLKTLSKELLKNHFALYEGYVSNTNKLYDFLSSLAESERLSSPQYAELKRRFGWEFNGMRLHELYFGNLVRGGKGPSEKSHLFKKISIAFGSFHSWQKDFVGTASMRGIGWAVLFFDSHSERLFNSWINEHNEGNLCGAMPILVIDVFEHAYMLDFGTKRADYLNEVLKIINWQEVEKRFDEALYFVSCLKSEEFAPEF